MFRKVEYKIEEDDNRKEEIKEVYERRILRKKLKWMIG